TGVTLSASSGSSSAGGGTPYQALLRFNSATAAITASCATAADCVCQFQWDDVNNTGGTAVAYKRMVRTPVSTVQAYLVLCAAPSVYDKEISLSTTISVQVVPSSGSVKPFGTNAFKFQKQALNAIGDFQDSEGRSYQNVYRYTCYDQFSKGL